MLVQPDFAQEPDKQCQVEIVAVSNAETLSPLTGFTALPLLRGGLALLAAVARRRG